MAVSAGVATAVGACVVSVVCGAGALAAVTAGSVTAGIAGGTAAHMALRTKKEKSTPATKWAKDTARSAGLGAVCGVTFGRGCAFWFAPRTPWAKAVIDKLIGRFR
jgi:hypothetical protein